MSVTYRPFDYSTVSHRGWPLRQRMSRRLLVALFRWLIRLEVAGLEHLPAEGAFILAANHLHVLDAAIGLLLVPRRVVGVAKDKWSRPPFGWLLGSMGDLVYVGARRRGAMTNAIEVLRAGAVLAILPEGTRSSTRALLRGQRGVAMVAARAPAPIVPAAAYGQERALEFWRRLRRVPVRVRVGPPIELPPGSHPRERLQAYADDVMHAIAAMLPPEYRGVYAEP
ncbi:MAG TPA: lysophospholipid acyltransferase family protein [Candidatus Dormibacteraeota bacterium]|jgi:1-acyl-sn-glycerol-3-phosphate acyltransferase